MNELKDYELETIHADSRTHPPEPPDLPEEPKGKSPLPWILLFLLALAVAGIYYFFFSKPTPPPPAPPPVAKPSVPAPQPPPPVEEEEEEAIELPPLDASDAFLQDFVSTLSAHPQWAKWLMTEGLARRLVVVADNVAEGTSPKIHLPFLAPRGKFKVVEEGGEIHPDGASFRRYDLLGDVITSLDPAGTAELFRQLEPLFQQAYEELGYPRRSFRDTLSKAIDHLLAAPVPEPDVALTRKILTYRYADPKLEGLSLAQRHLLRMGPNNVRRVQAKLRQLRAALNE